MSTLDMIITATDCPKCGAYHHLRAWIVPTGYDEGGHADEIEVSSIECPTCGYEPPEDDPIWDKVLESAYKTHTDYSLVEIGRIYQELK